MSDADPLALATQARSQRRSFRRLTDLVLRCIRLVWLAAPRAFSALLALQVVGALALAAQVLVVQATLNAILGVAAGRSGFSGLLLPVALLALLTALAAVIGSVQGGLSRYVAESVAALMWQRVLAVSTGVSLGQFESADFFDRLQRVQTSALARPYQVTQGVIGAVGAAAASIGLGAAILALHPALLPLLVVGGLPLLLTSRRESRLEFDFTVRQTPAIRMRMYLTVLQTNRDEAKEVRAFGLASALRQRFEGLYATYLADLARHVRRRAVLNVVGNLGSALVLGGTLLALVWLISVGQISIAEAGAALVAIRLLAGQVQGFFGGIQTIFESGLFLDDLEEFLRIEADAAPAKPEPPAFEEVRTDAVTFTYPGADTPALREVDVRVGPGQVVALVGENGSGKTTLAKIIAGLYAPDDGAVLWNGRDTRSYAPQSVRDQIAVIFQDFVQYALSAEENITFGRIDRPVVEAEVRSAARRAGADEFLADLPSGYQTPLSRLFSGGQELSGGQWQRVALARAFYRDAPLVILDEPSASLDPRAEYELFATLRAVLQGRSALFISHRFSTVRNADLIYVLDDGRVVEQGSHADLMELDGQYAELFRLQEAAFSAEQG